LDVKKLNNDTYLLVKEKDDKNENDDELLDEPNEENKSLLNR